MHGKDATPRDKWYPWFGEQVKRLGHEYIAPELPNPSEPIFDEWIEGLDSCKPDEDTILIGHSRGGAAVMRWLEMQPPEVRVRKVILVAANSGRIEANLPPNESKKGFYNKNGYNFEKIKSHCDDFVVFHSTDDKWVPYTSGEENTAGLSARFMSYTDKGHFGKAIGEFPELLEELL